MGALFSPASGSEQSKCSQSVTLPSARDICNLHALSTLPSVQIQILPHATNLQNENMSRTLEYHFHHLKLEYLANFEQLRSFQCAMHHLVLHKSRFWEHNSARDLTTGMAPKAHHTASCSNHPQRSPIASNRPCRDMNSEWLAHELVPKSAQETPSQFARQIRANRCATDAGPSAGLAIGTHHALGLGARLKSATPCWQDLRQLSTKGMPFWGSFRNCLP